MIDNPLFQWPWQLREAIVLKKKKGLFLNGFSTILVKNMLSFRNKHACLLVSCPSENKRTEYTMPGKKKSNFPCML